MTTAQTTAAAPKSKRTYGTGCIYTSPTPNRAGQEVLRAKFRVNGQRYDRELGPKRTRGQADGLTTKQAEAVLRDLITTMTAAAPAPVPAERRDYPLANAARDYIASREQKGRKDSTVTDYVSAL